MYGAMLAAVLGLTACSGNSGDASDSAKMNGISIDSALPDTFAVDSTQNADKPLRIRSKQEILNYIAKSPDRAKYEEGIIPTMAEYVPEYASRLLDNTYDGFLIVDKNTMKLYRYDKYGREQENVGIACSMRYGTKHKKADNRTPEGFFSIEGIYDSTNWLYTNDAGYTSPARGQFGPRFMRLRTDVTTQVGIHGTAAPGSIGGRRSHGCIRMTNENILRIHKLCKAGMPVIVSPGPRDMAVNESEGYHVPSVPVKPGVAPCVAGNMSDYEREHPNSEKPATKPAATPAAKTKSDSTVAPETEVAPATESAPAENVAPATAAPAETPAPAATAAPAAPAEPTPAQ